MPLHPLGPEGSAGHQPGTPTIGSASAGNASASVSFTAPDYLGKPIGTTYTATSTPSSITGTGSSSPITVSGLSNGTSYTFKVKLGNSIVDSLESAASNSVTPVAPPSFPFFPPDFQPATTYYASACCDGSQITASSQISAAAALSLLDCANGYYSAETSTSGYPSVTCIYYAAACCNSSGEPSYAVSATGYTAVLAQNALTCPGTLSSIDVGSTPRTTPQCGSTPPSFPFFPPSFPFFPPSFPTFEGPFFPPDFPYFPWFYGFESVASTTGIMTTSGRKDAKDIVVGDKLYAMNIDGIDRSALDWMSWSQSNPTFDESNVVETTVTQVLQNQVSKLYLVNGDMYSADHFIMTKKDNVARLIRVTELDTSYQVFSYTEMNFTDIVSLESIDVEDTIYSIHCEPYDNFFTENMLVFDAFDDPNAS